MNDIQSKLLEIAKAFIATCDRLGLSYFAIGGTALGAMRHNGFIPWDDDIDFVMPRKDYDIFVDKAKYYLDCKYFVQEHKTEKKYYYPYCKLRDSTTTAVEYSTRKLCINHGLWIDIFPLDNMPIQEKAIKRINRLRFNFFERRFLIERYSWGGFKNTVYNLFIRLLLPSKKVAFNIYSRLIKKAASKNTGYLWWNWNKMGKPTLEKDWFSNFSLSKFEDIMIRVPYKCDEYLTSHYGNWKELPPIGEQKSSHSIILIDINKSYLCYDLKNYRDRANKQ